MKSTQVASKPETETTSAERIKKLSVVVPVFNSDKTLHELFSRLKDVFEQIEQDFEVLFVDDFSSDRSWDVIRQLKEEHPSVVTGIRLATNTGQHNATLCGLFFSAGDMMITIDDDLQVPPEEIPKLIDHYQHTNADVVYGIYANKKHSSFRNLGSKIMEKIIQNYANSPGKGSSFKLIKGDIAHQITKLNHTNIFLDEIIGWFTDDIQYVEVEHIERKEGQSGYSTLKLIFTTTNILVNYTALPLRMMTYGGLFFALLFFCLGIYYIYNKIFYAVQLGFTSLIVTIFFATSLILLCLGIIGEYIRRLYLSYQNKPAFSVKELLK